MLVSMFASVNKQQQQKKCLCYAVNLKKKVNLLKYRKTRIKIYNFFQMVPSPIKALSSTETQEIDIFSRLDKVFIKPSFKIKNIRFNSSLQLRPSILA